MSSEKSRSKATALVAKAEGVSSMAIIGDGKDRLEVVGVNVNTVCLAASLRKKVGHTDIVKVEEVKDKPEETTETRIVEVSPYDCTCSNGYYYPRHRHRY